MLDLFFLPVRLFVAVPFLALAPAAAFAACDWRRRQSYGAAGLMVPISAIVWAAYATHETNMYVWAQTVIAPIRVDLLFLTPVLHAVTAAGTVACRSRRGAGPGRDMP